MEDGEVIAKRRAAPGSISNCGQQTVPAGLDRTVRSQVYGQASC